MRLNYKAFLLTATVAFAAAAAAQTTTPPSNSTPQNVPDEPMPGTTAQTPTTPPGQTETTPGQTQSMPGEATQSTPAQTGQTPSGNTTAAPATAADVKSGVAVYDQKGGEVGKIKSVSGENAVVDTGTIRAQVPISSLAKNDKGLVISMTKAELEAAAKKSPSKPK